MTTTFDAYEIPVDFYVEPDSSFIDVVAYSESDGGCYVVIHGTIYRYDDVFYGDFKDLVTANSVGRQYHEFSKTYGPSRSLPSGGSFGLRDDSDLTPEQGGLHGTIPDTPENREFFERLTADDREDLAASDEAAKEETTPLSEWLTSYLPAVGLENASPENDNVITLTAAPFELRLEALNAACRVFEGRKTRAGEVIALAKKFEEYLNGTN